MERKVITLDHLGSLHVAPFQFCFLEKKKKATPSGEELYTYTEHYNEHANCILLHLQFLFYF